MRICEGELKIIYKNNKPCGVRDSSGFLFFFADVSKYQGQEERYRLEVEQQYKLADFLLAALQSYNAELTGREPRDLNNE